MTNAEYLISVLQDPDKVDDAEILRVIPCQYSLADMTAPCALIKDYEIDTHFCAKCSRDWLRKEKK